MIDSGQEHINAQWYAVELAAALIARDNESLADGPRGSARALHPEQRMNLMRFAMSVKESDWRYTKANISDLYRIATGVRKIKIPE